MQKKYIYRQNKINKFFDQSNSLEIHLLNSYLIQTWDDIQVFSEILNQINKKTQRYFRNIDMIIQNFQNRSPRPCSS